MNRRHDVPPRLGRAATLRVRPLGNNVWGRAMYEVTGGAADHTVTFPREPGPSHLSVWCDCEDFLRGRGTRACKHVLAVAITLATDEERADIAALLGIEV